MQNKFLDFTILPWDSAFFEFKVARVNTTEINAGLLNELYRQNVELAYFSAAKKLDDTQSELYEIKLVDKKLTYAKEVVQVSLDNTIVSYPLHFPEEALLALAIRSGLYSRYYTDEKIDRKKFEQLYRQWIINAVEKKMASEVLVQYKDKELTGFVTVGNKDDRADIGLIAVAENFGRQGIGKALMEGAEHHAVKQQYKAIQVVTQAYNTAACKLYESCGYQLEQAEFFYHLWKK